MKTVVHTPESDAIALTRISETFEVLDDITQAIAQNKAKGLIVYGPAGVGKSRNVKEVLEIDSLPLTLRDQPAKYEFVLGYMRPIFLYKKLYDCRNAGQILVLDDCDSVLSDPDALNLLKAALDTTKERWISWNSGARFLKDEGLPNKFKFEGGIILLTNIDFENCRISKLTEHLKAIMSRCHYLDLSMNTSRDRYLWIHKIAKGSDMLTSRGLTQNDIDVLLAYVEEHVNDVKHLDLRLMHLLADHYILDQKNWLKKANITCLKRKIS